jgi:hypothetical protein
VRGILSSKGPIIQSARQAAALFLIAPMTAVGMEDLLLVRLHCRAGLLDESCGEPRGLRLARSVAPTSNPPASDVTSPASNAATTGRPSTLPKSNCSGRHSVGIGALLESEKSRCGTTTFADSQPRCAQLFEKCGLVSVVAKPIFRLQIAFSKCKLKVLCQCGGVCPVSEMPCSSLKTRAIV